MKWFVAVFIAGGILAILDKGYGIYLMALAVAIGILYKNYAPKERQLFRTKTIGLVYALIILIFAIAGLLFEFKIL